MPSETPCRLALLVVVLLTAGVSFYYRLRAAASGEKISHREEGYLFAAVLRLAGVGLWISTLAWLVYPPAVGWAAFPLPAAVRWLAVAAAAGGGLLMCWTLRSLGKNLTDTVVTRTHATLVTTGPYRWVRHPFYVTAALLMISATLVAANWLIGLFSLLGLALLAVRTPKEERLLIERFGDDYRRYMAGRGRYFPRLRR